MRFSRPGLRAHTVFALLVLLGACKKGAPPPAAPALRAELPPREVSRASALLYTYVDASGMFATSEQAEKVPDVGRRVVRIMGQGRGEVQRRNNLNVEVIDLRDLLAKGRTQPRVMLREEFESRALAQLPPGDSCALSDPHGPPLADEPDRAGSADEPPIAILYGTRWCKACKAARRYLSFNLIPFTAKDVEKDPSAARELQEKVSRFGIAADRVPILDVRGRLLVGFDETRMNGLLADW